MKTSVLSLVGVFIGLLHPLGSAAQAPNGPAIQKANWCIVPAFQYGYVFPTNHFLRGSNREQEPIRAFGAASIRLGKQTTGNKPWQLNYANPVYGVGISAIRFSEPEELGKPFAVFGYFNAPFHRWTKLSLEYDIALGLAFNWKPFNPVNNANNLSIGAKESVYLDVGVQAAFRLVGRFSGSAGLSIAHYSNGALKKPNLGVNTVAPRMALRYDLYTVPLSRPVKSQRAPFTASTQLDLSVFAGSQNVIYDSLPVDVVEGYEGVNFLAMGVNVCLARHLTHKSKIGFGFTADYNGAHDAQVSVDNGEVEAADSPFADKLQLSVFPSYELVVHRVSVLVQPSFYVARKNIPQQTPWFYQRIGIKYHAYRNLFVGVSLRAYQFNVSEFLEWNIGYRFIRNKGNPLSP
ncbi:MAG: acyloxyacyl hydrolase [Flavobacteriales bacterium]|nr:MAG: acyloxyacyl hydrolase [Flavobacteriales bacterium]